MESICRLHESGSYYTFPSIDRLGFVKAAFSTRLGGVSKGPYKWLNMACHSGDEEEDVLRNRRIFMEHLELSSNNWVSGEQAHGDKIVVVEKKDCSSGFRNYNESIAGTDGLITNCEGPFLMGFFADCVPVYIIDRKKRVVALIHAGWKGTVKKIAYRAIKKMEESFYTDPEDCLVVIGPSIGQCCYKVRANVAEEFQAGFARDKQHFIKLSMDNTFYINLQEANKIALEEAGISSNNIYLSNLCTSCRVDLFYSYRKEGITGRMAAAIWLL